MQIFSQPKVYLIMKPAICWIEIHRILREVYNHDTWINTSFSPGDQIAEFAGRVCYGAFGAKQHRTDSGEYINNVIGQGHGSVFEHANYTFLITQANRSYTHEQVRHRAGWAYSQESTRFCEYTDDTARMVFPGYDEMDEDTKHTIAEGLKENLSTYRDMLDSLKESEMEADGKLKLSIKAKKKVLTSARDLLCHAIEAKIVVTANIRALRFFFEKRTAPDAAMQIRQVALQMLSIMKEVSPLCFADFETYVVEGETFAKNKYNKI